MDNNISIEGFKEHRGSYDIITKIREFLIEAEIKENFIDIKKGLRVLITESAPYNLNWEKDLEELNKEVLKLYDEKFYNNKGELKTDISLKNEFYKLKAEFIHYCMILKANLLKSFSQANLIPATTKNKSKMSERTDNKEDKEFYEDMEEVGLM